MYELSWLIFRQYVYLQLHNCFKFGILLIKLILLYFRKPAKGVKFMIENGFIKNDAPAVANFLLDRAGLSREKVGLYLGDTQKMFNQAVLE